MSMKIQLVGVMTIAAGLAFGGVTWTNDMATLEFNWAGGVKSLKERATGRELVKEGAFLFLSLKSGNLLYPKGIEALGNGLYRWSFAERGTLTLKVHSFGLGWTYELTELTVRDVQLIYFGWLNPLLQKWLSNNLNAFSDEQSAVILRSYRPEIGMHTRDRTAVFLDVSDALFPGFVGAQGGIVAGPREKLTEALKQMAEDAKLFHTCCSGPWALGSERAKGSYLFTEMSPGSSDDWIDLAERGGFDTIHMHNAGSRGHHTPTPVLYPKGYEDVRRCADLIHGAGLRVGMHSLTAGINPRDPWITPVCRTDLLVRCTHTLAKPLGENDTEMFVVEKPEKEHDTFHSYSTRGNTFLCDGELIQYTGIRREPPYAFTGVTRGAWKTAKRGLLPAGTKIHYLHQMYDAFYPQPNSKLADEMGDAIAKMFHCGNMDLIYFDGSEGAACPPHARYNIDALRLGFARKLGPNALIEGACTQAPDCWFYIARYGAWDHALWGAKLFQDQHSRDKDAIRMGSLLEPQMGWWKPRQADGSSRGHFLDEMEYFAKRNAADDAAMSLQGVDLRRQRITPFAITAQMTVLGWYERMRRAHLFNDAALELFDKKGVDARLRQDVDGQWYARRSDAIKRRVTNVGDGSETFSVKVPRACSAAIRVEALYGADRAQAGKVVLAPTTALEVSAATEPKMVASLAHGHSEHGQTFVLTAKNAGQVLRGSWAKWGWSMGMPYYDAGDSESFGFWVKGDGKGETLCLQLRNGREYGNALSDHYVKIDFTGWRYIEVLSRERDAARFEEFLWPYSHTHNMKYISSHLNQRKIAEINLLLNEVPAGETATVEVSTIVGKPIMRNETQQASVTVNGETFAIPFALTSGEYAELDEGAWVKFSEKGMPVARAEAPRVSLKAGDNAIVYGGKPSVGSARAEVTVFALGKRFRATKEMSALTPAAQRQIAYEAELPVKYAPENGFDGRVPVRVRPGEKAFLELRLFGPVEKPTLTIRDGSKRSWTFPVSLTAEDRLFCRDGRVWYVLRETGCDSSAIVAKGELKVPLPALEVSTGFVLSSPVPQKANAELDVIKRYATGKDHPNLARKYTFGQGKSGEGTTEGILNANWSTAEK